MVDALKGVCRVLIRMKDAHVKARQGLKSLKNTERATGRRGTRYEVQSKHSL